MEPSTVTKMALGCFGVALSYLIMAGAAWSAGGNSATGGGCSPISVVITIGDSILPHRLIVGFEDCASAA